MTDATMTNMIDVQKLADAEAEVAKLQCEYDKAYDEFQQAHAALINKLDTAKTNRDMVKFVVRDNALINYNATGNKKPHPAVSIAIYHKALWEEEEALSWLETNAPNYIERKVDKKRFEKAVRDGTLRNAPVTIVEEQIAKIKQDLSDYISL